MRTTRLEANPVIRLSPNMHQCEASAIDIDAHDQTAVRNQW